jgi:ubiquinone biosynthesis monooxygenase Coq7
MIGRQRKLAPVCFFGVAMNFIDSLITEFDRGLRTVFAPATERRDLPVSAGGDAPMPSLEKVESGRLMRVNHTGEICAQALYQGQALVARDPEIRQVLLHAADEERDHLAWCERRLDALGASTSVLNPLWYAGSFTLGMVSGALGDKWSMAFLVETERQVERHLDGHLRRLPAADAASRAVLEAMREDEIRHGDSGERHGAASMPAPVKAGMRLVSKVMTRTAYWV